MSTIKAANVQNTGSGAPTFKNSSGTEIGQLAKAWVNFDGGRGGSVSIRDDYNVSSITDNNTGDYTVNFSSNMPNTNYCVSLGQGDGSTHSSIPYGLFFTTGGYGETHSATTSAIRVHSQGYTGQKYDAAHNYVTIFADG